MENKKGFTLIELLAIIVILAIIAVITVPIILGIIDNSKKGAVKDSAYGYKDAVEKFYLNDLSLKSNSKLDGFYYIVDDDLIQVSQDEGVIHNKLEISGKKPSNGYLNYSDNKISDGCLLFDEYAVTFRDGELFKTEKGTECEMVVHGNLNISYITPDGESATKSNYLPVYIEKQGAGTILYGIKLIDAYALEVTFDGIRVVENAYLSLDSCNQVLSDLEVSKTPEEYATLMETYKPECVPFTFVNSYSKGSSISSDVVNVKVCGEHDGNYICLEPKNYQENMTTLTSAGCTVDNSNSNKFYCSASTFNLDEFYVDVEGMDVETGEYLLCSGQYDSIDDEYDLGCVYK